MPRVALIIAIAISMLAPAQRELPSVVGAQKFVSLDGRFSISLPDRNGYGPLVISTPFGKATGDLYEWDTKEGTFGVGYADAAQPLDDPQTAKQFFNRATELFKKLATANSGNVAAVKPITLGKYPGIEQRADLFTGAIIQRTYLVSRRIYELVAVVKNSQRVYESVAAGALDSFKILTDAEIALKRSEEAAKAEPSPLPQAPVAPRAGSDASDEGLRGRVKSVLVESQDLSGRLSVQGRKRDSVEVFNEQGNKVKAEAYDPRGNLDEITVFGYINGGRVSASKRVEHAYNPPIAMAPPDSMIKKSDPRYQNRLEYKYDEKKRLIELTWLHSNGDVWMRYVYKYNGNQKEELVYSGDGSLNQHYLYTLDDKGNEVEQTSFARDGSVSRKNSFQYEFDSHGNWIKRTTSRVVMKDGREQLEPSSVRFRTITYY